MNDTTAKIAAKGCKSTGITEDLAVRYHDNLGKKIMAIVELEAAARGENVDGKQQVQLRILSVEPATDQISEDHLRDVQRALFMNRRLDEDQPTLDGDEPEPKVKDVIEGRGQAILERDDDGQVTGLWDGNTDDELDLDDDTDEDQDDDGAPNPDDQAYEPHPYVDTAHAVCGYHGCGQPAGAAIHTPDPVPIAG